MRNRVKVFYVECIRMDIELKYSTFLITDIVVISGKNERRIIQVPTVFPPLPAPINPRILKFLLNTGIDRNSN